MWSAGLTGSFLYANPVLQQPVKNTLMCYTRSGLHLESEEGGRFWSTQWIAMSICSKCLQISNFVTKCKWRLWASIVFTTKAKRELVSQNSAVCSDQLSKCFHLYAFIIKNCLQSTSCHLFVIWAIVFISLNTVGVLVHLI